MMKRIKFIKFIVIVTATLSFFPLFANAFSCAGYGAGGAPGSEPSTFAEVICIFLGFIGTTIPIMVGLALLAFFWGLANFILSAGDEKKLQDGKKLMFWGIIGLFVMVSIWGIINLIYSDFFGGSIGLPTLPT